VAGQWLSPGTPVSSTNETDHHNITELLFNVALNTIKEDKDKDLNIRVGRASNFPPGLSYKCFNKFKTAG
jgi:hypothetical protein